MSERDRKLVAAALSVFARYGVAKTTMNDIAREAGVARQTLYNAFPSKDAILRAAVQASGQKTRADVEARWAQLTTLADKIQAFHEDVPLGWFDMIQTFPDVAELIDGIHTTAKAEMEEIASEWVARFKELIVEYAAPGSAAKDAPEAVADFIYSASINAKYGAETRAMLEGRLRLLKQAILVLFDRP